MCPLLVSSVAVEEKQGSSRGLPYTDGCIGEVQSLFVNGIVLRDFYGVLRRAAAVSGMVFPSTVANGVQEGKYSHSMDRFSSFYQVPDLMLEYR